VATPTQSELVKVVLRGIKRSNGRPQKQAKALLRDDLLVVLDAIGDGLKDARDKALLLIGFAGGFRLQRDNYDGRLPTIKLAKSGSRRVARRELPV
jgi:integrase